MPSQSVFQSFKTRVATFQTKRENQQLKEAAADPKNPQALANLLAKAQGTHGAGNVTPCIKRTLFGTPYVSVNLPKGKEAKEALRKFGYLLTDMGASHTGTSTCKEACSLSSFTNAYRSIRPEHLAEHTTALEGHVRKLANQKQAQVSRVKGAAGTVQPAASRVHTPTPVLAESETAAAPVSTATTLPQFPSAAQLNQFQLDLQRGHIKRPAHPDVTQFVNHLNRTEGTTAGRSFPGGERNEVNDLLAYIADNITAVHTWKEGEGLVGRPTNTFDGRTFESRLEAAHFLFTETDFFKNLNARDAAIYMGIFQDRIQEAQKAQREQQRLG